MRIYYRTLQCCESDGILIVFFLDMIAFFSFRFFIDLIRGNPYPFAFNYTFGHILQLSASTFLCGPKRQFKNMFDSKRRETSIVYLSCLVLTLLFVFIPLPGPLKLIVLLSLMMTQFCASLWYSLSYIPYGRRTVLQCMKRQLGIEDAPSSGYTNITMPSIRLGTASV
jgi:Got1/Sft2-like family